MVAHALVVNAPTGMSNRYSWVWHWEHSPREQHYEVLLSTFWWLLGWTAAMVWWFSSRSSRGFWVRSDPLSGSHQKKFRLKPVLIMDHIRRKTDGDYSWWCTKLPLNMWSPRSTLNGILDSWSVISISDILRASAYHKSCQDPSSVHSWYSSVHSRAANFTTAEGRVILWHFSVDNHPNSHQMTRSTGGRQLRRHSGWWCGIYIM